MLERLFAILSIGLLVSSAISQSRVSRELVSEKRLARFLSFSNVPGSTVVSPDGRHLAYIANARGRYSVIIDGKEQSQYDEIVDSAPVFSPDGQHVAYVAGRMESSLWSWTAEKESRVNLPLNSRIPLVIYS